MNVLKNKSGYACRTCETCLNMFRTIREIVSIYSETIILYFEYIMCDIISFAVLTIVINPKQLQRGL